MPETSAITLAQQYRAAGWGPLPLPGGQKKPVPRGFTGREHPDVLASEKQLLDWRVSGKLTQHSNLGVRMPRGVVGIDIDAYGTKTGGESLETLVYTLGALPLAPRSTARAGDSVSGIRFFRIPEDVELSEARAGDNIELLQHHHRYAVVYPSIHPDTDEQYQWYDELGDPMGADIPPVDTLPLLPTAWVEYLRATPESIEREQAAAAAAEHDDSVELAPSPATERYARRAVDAELFRLDECQANVDMPAGTEPLWNETTYEAACALVRHGNNPQSGLTLDDVRTEFMEHAPDDEGAFSTAIHESIWGRAVQKIGDYYRRYQVSDDDSGDPSADFERAEVDSVSIVDENEIRIVRYIVHQHLADSLLTYDRQSWAAWDGAKWDVDSGGDLALGYLHDAGTRMHKTFVAEIKQAVKDAGGIDEFGKAEYARLMTKARKFSSLNYTKVLTTHVRPYLATKLTAFDLPSVTKDFVNCPNGIVDSGGELRPHDKSLRFTKTTGVPYTGPRPLHPDIRQLLSALPEDLHDYVQLKLGQSLTGEMPSDGKIMVWQGGGQNGKSLLLDVVKRVFGDFAGQISDKAVLAAPGSHPTELMDFRGLRLAYLEEMPDGVVNEHRVKQLVGTPRITARQMRENFVTFTATHSMIITTNPDLKIVSTDHAIWRRFVKIDFPYTFDGSDPEHLPDPDLAGRIFRNAEGQLESFLAWIVEGMKRYYLMGLTDDDMPARARQSMTEWRATENIAHRFFHECFEPAEGNAVLSMDAYQMFRLWAQESGYRLYPAKATFWERAGQSPFFVDNGVERKQTRNPHMQYRMPDTGLRSIPKQPTVLVGVRLSEDGEHLFDQL